MHACLCVHACVLMCACVLVCAHALSCKICVCVCMHLIAGVRQCGIWWQLIPWKLSLYAATDCLMISMHWLNVLSSSYKHQAARDGQEWWLWHWMKAASLAHRSWKSCTSISVASFLSMPDLCLCVCWMQQWWLPHSSSRKCSSWMKGMTLPRSRTLCTFWTQTKPHIVVSQTKTWPSSCRPSCDHQYCVPLVFHGSVHRLCYWYSSPARW